MPKFIIGPNHLGLEGEYELEMTFFNKDHRKIKKVSGLRVLEYQEALEAGDLDFIIALASIALDRAGKQHNIEHLYELPDDSIKFVIEEEENPPPIAPEPSPEEESQSSGLSSNGATEPSQEKSTLDSSGTPLLESSSDPLTSTT
jgi:hypothetical protein